jgi:cytochrome b561
MNWFLRAKHWQLFLLILGIPLFAEIIGFALVIITRSMNGLMIMFPIMMLSAVIGQFGWMLSVGTKLQLRLPPEGRMNVKRFRFFILFMLFYMLLIGLIVSGVILATMNGFKPSPYMALSFLIIIPAHFFSMFCIFYGIWFVAKSFKQNELWRPVVFNDYMAEFFLIWFFVIGVWIIQPKINKMFEGQV